MRCWGYNGNGRLGDGTTTERHTPTQTASLGDNAAIATIFREHTGQSNQTACAVGTYLANSGQSSCDDADA